MRNFSPSPKFSEPVEQRVPGPNRTSGLFLQSTQVTRVQGQECAPSRDNCCPLNRGDVLHMIRKISLNVTRLNFQQTHALVLRHWVFSKCGNLLPRLIRESPDLCESCLAGKVSGLSQGQVRTGQGCWTERKASRD